MFRVMQCLLESFGRFAQVVGQGGYGEGLTKLFRPLPAEDFLPVVTVGVHHCPDILSNFTGMVLQRNGNLPGFRQRLLYAHLRPPLTIHGDTAGR